MLLRLIKQLVSRQPKAPPTAPSPVTVTASPADALLGKADQLALNKDWAGAEALIREALRLDGSKLEAHHALGEALYGQGKFNDALIHASYAAFHQPDCAKYLHLKGLINLGLRSHQNAREALLEAYRLDPKNPNLVNNLGLAENNPQASYARFSEAVALDPSMAEARANKALAAIQIGLSNEATSEIEALIRLEPDNLAYQLKQISIYLDSGRLNEAKSILSQLTRKGVTSVEHAILLARCALKEGKPSLALEHAKKVVSEEPSPPNHYFLSEIFLLLGQWPQGWEYYDERFGLPGFFYRSSPVPPWQGEPLKGKSIYLLAEQGIGDQIMFSSCVPDLLAQGARVTLECDERLATLFSRSYATATIEGYPALPPRPPQAGYDYISYIGSLPKYLRRNPEEFIGRTPFLKTQTPSDLHHKKIGVSWRGGLPWTGSAERSLPLEQFLTALPEFDGSYISLQRDETPDERALIAQRSKDFQGFNHDHENLDLLADAIAQCRLIVTVCCSVAHLAGALGVPALVLVPLGASWRYGEKGEYSPWYPSLKLLRKTEHDWDPILKQLRNEINLLDKAQG